MHGRAALSLECNRIAVLEGSPADHFPGTVQDQTTRNAVPRALFSRNRRGNKDENAASLPPAPLRRLTLKLPDDSNRSTSEFLLCRYFNRERVPAEDSQFGLCIRADTGLGQPSKLKGRILVLGTSRCNCWADLLLTHLRRETCLCV